jgi:hypothetical protein
MLFYLNSEQTISAGSIIEIPANIVMFQELETAEIDISPKSKAKTYKIILDVTIHDPLIPNQSDHVYTAMENGRYPDHETDDGLFRFELMEKITNTETSRDIFSTFALLEQIKNFGFDGVFFFEDYRRAAIIVNKCFGKVIGIATEEK